MAAVGSSRSFHPRVSVRQDAQSPSARARHREITKARRPLVGMLYGAMLAVPLWALILKAVGLY